ncbi:hypothetical protein ACFFQF_06495 [Haladaptatus pallidirubidus]|uniref:hypothetical protein n=1 Tax=Haladaptatus pallidirubidus TaxID=1008152 RepID=UPI0035E85AD5
MREREAEGQPRETDDKSKEPRPRRSENQQNQRESEPSELKKYGGPRDPDWKRRRQLQKAERRGNERTMDVAFGQRRAGRPKKRYQRGRRNWR